MLENERLKKVFLWVISQGLAETQEDIAKSIGINHSYLSQVVSGRRPLSSKLLDNICSKYEKVNSIWIKTGEGNMIKSTNPEPVGELKEKQYSSYVNVKLVTTKARAGYTHAYYADEYLEDMPTVVMEADVEYKGKYLAFEVDGDSMEPDYHKGDVVICRELRRDLWRYKLHYNDYDFVIAHSTKGVMLKQIIDHDIETGEIVCHSVNSEGFLDFTLNLREVAYLFNVVEHRISGKNKRRYR